MYKINPNTKIIKLKKNGYFNTKIIEGDEEKYFTESPMKIIEKNCEARGSDFRERLIYVRGILKSNSKLPILIDSLKGIFLFPTSSNRNKKCTWITYYQVKDYEKRGKMTYVHFKDNTGLYIHVSYNQFDLQFKRTSQVIAHHFKMRF